MDRDDKGDLLPDEWWTCCACGARVQVDMWSYGYASDGVLLVRCGTCKAADRKPEALEKTQENILRF